MAPQTVHTPLEKLWAPVAGSVVVLITVPQAVQVTVSEPAAPQVGSTRAVEVLLWGHWVGAGGVELLVLELLAGNLRLALGLLAPERMWLCFLLSELLSCGLALLLYRQICRQKLSRLS